ncbi:MAG: GNAT family N-acetyltransferase [Treponema sp.]|jgi:GNAT superfamily N-acetyltransferase|nr:GNAT family N-acetyltransferase [Treponema sp.]
MQFELTPALIDEILFFMEDQHGEFLVDTQEGIVISADDEEFDNEADDDRYISLPEWDSSEGFRMMGHFTATLRNALVREELSAALDRGRGVFRAFKNTLSRYPETEKLWFAYKEREMKRVIVSWYNALRESWGLELIGEEPEDIEGLALEDFNFREGAEGDRHRAEKLHQSCAGECGGADILSGMGGWVFPGDISFVAETAGGDFAGYISAQRSSEALLRICALETEREYRGLGLGKELVARLLEKADSLNIANVVIDLPAGQEFFSRALLRESFRPCVMRYCREQTTDNG